MGEHAIQRKIFKKIAAEVSNNECVDALRHYIYSQLPPPFNDVTSPPSLNLAKFLAHNSDQINAIPTSVLDPLEREKLKVKSTDNFDIKDLNVTTLAVITRYLIPTIPGHPVEPNNSIWRTRLKLLDSATKLHHFIRLWRLWNKYQHNQEMNHSNDEIFHDFAAMQRAVEALIEDQSSMTRRKVIRFKKFYTLVEGEKRMVVLKSLYRNFDKIVDDLHEDTSVLEPMLMSSLEKVVTSVDTDMN